MTPEDISHSHDFSIDETTPAQTIKVIGVGGGGNNAVDHMYKHGIKDVSFVLINTDKQAMLKSQIPTRLVIGEGRGAGGKPERARQYAEDNADKIAELFDDDTDMVFITAGMGGGTGTGAGPVVARIAKERNILTVGIVSIPFLFEGRQKVLKALEGAKEMSKNVDALMIINNERLSEIYPDLGLLNAFSRADDTLLIAAQGITDIITNTGIINRDFNDVDSALRDGGTAIISTGYGEGENRVSNAIQDALTSPLLKNTDIEGSKKLLIVLYIDEEEGNTFAAKEINQLRDFTSTIDPNVDVMWGLYTLPGLGEKVKITILASGFDVTVDETAPAPEPHNIIEERKKEDETIAKGYDPAAAAALSGNKINIIAPEDLDKDDVIARIEEPSYDRARRSTIASRPARTNPAKHQRDDAAPAGPKTNIDFSDID